MQILYPAYASISISVPDVATLRTIPIAEVTDQTLAFVGGQTSPLDGNGGIYQWSPSSTAADDGQNTIQLAQVSIGRFVRIIAGIAGTGLSQSSVGFFTGLAAISVPSAVSLIFTNGYSQLGIGAGFYTSDSLATSALATAIPRFCKQSADGRYWRLLPDGGVIAISQGGALGGTANDQPAVQAAIDYAKAIQCRTLLFDFDTVSIWNTVRTSDAGQNTTDPSAQDGQSIWVTAPIKFLGVGTMTHILMLSTIGTSLETGWQNVGGNVWRGSGINLIGGTLAAPNANNLTAFEMENIWLDGGCAFTGVRTAVTPSSPDGPDLTNKGIRLQGTQCDALVLTNCKIGGFKGETAYVAGTTQMVQVLRRLECYGSNQSLYNPSEGVVDAEFCVFHDATGFEALGGIGGRFSSCQFTNITQMNFTGGPANGLLYNYAYPTRVANQDPPWFDLIDCDFQNAGQIIVGSFVRILNFTATDCSFYLDTDQAGIGGNGSLTSCYIRGRFTVDQNSAVPICTIIGPPNLTTVIGGAPDGTFIVPPQDVHIEFDVHRTANAISNNRFAVGFTLNGFFDPNSCSLSINQADGVAFMIDAPSNTGLPLVTMEGPTSSQLIGSGKPMGVLPVTISSGPYALTVTNPRHSLLYAGTATTIAITMTPPHSSSYGYANGQRIRLYWDIGSTTGTVYTLARNGTGLRLNSDCALSSFSDWLELEFNSSNNLWLEVNRSTQSASSSSYLTSGTNWKFVNDSGLIEMGGTVPTAITGEGAISLTFPFGGFPTDCLDISCAPINSASSSNNDTTIQQVSVSATTANFFANSPTGAGFSDAAGGYRWRALGY